jgi:hypothetical protein
LYPDVIVTILAKPHLPEIIRSWLLQTITFNKL